MSRRFLFIAWLSFSFVLTVRSQRTSEVKLTKMPDKNYCIEFTCDKMIYNVLVVVSDSSSNTLFLDNRYQFTGPYKFIIDMKKCKKGHYDVEIIMDEVHFRRKINHE